MSEIHVTRFGADDELWDSDRDTGVQVEKTADDDTVRIDAGGNTDIAKVTSTKVHFNDDGDDVDFQIEGDTEPFGFYYNGGADAAGFGTDDPVFVREGTTKSSRFGVLKRDAAVSNAGFFAIASGTTTRGVDISFLKCTGTWASKGSVGNNDVVLEYASEGYDGTDFNRSAVIRAIVDGTVSADTVPQEWVFLTSQTNDGGLQSAMRIRANRTVQFGAGRTTPNVTIDASGNTVFNVQSADVDLRIATDANTHAVFVDGSTNSVGFNNSTPSGAWVHIGAGTTTSAPFKYTSGTNLTTPANGAKEYDGSNEFLTVGGVRYTLAKTLTAMATLDFGSIAAGATETLTITVTGAVSGDVVTIGVPNGSMHADIDYFAWVSANDTVSIRCRNFGAGAVDPASGTFRASIIKY